MPSLRPNEHLAVLLPKSLWKPDSAAPHCDNFFCRISFSLFERKHHCRKCGGIYCAACASRFTSLLDTSHLDFITPPRNVPISEFSSSQSPVLHSRVCEDCFDQIHGCPTTPRSPECTRTAFSHILTHPIAIIRQFVPIPPPSPVCTSSSSSSSDETTKLNWSAPLLRHKQSTSSVNTLYSSVSAPPQQVTPPTLAIGRVPLPENLEKSYGELDAYPLRRSSVLCKATGGGRWEPKKSPVLDFYRVPIPGAKAPFEVEMERQEQLEQLRRQNPIVKDGDFQYRFQKDPEPAELSRSIYRLSTF